MSWDDLPVTHSRVCAFAFHEVCEVMCSNMNTIAKVDVSPTFSVNFDAARHEMINTLQHVLWLPDYTCRYLMEDDI